MSGKEVDGAVPLLSPEIIAIDERLAGAAADNDGSTAPIDLREGERFAWTTLDGHRADLEVALRACAERGSCQRAFTLATQERLRGTLRLIRQELSIGESYSAQATCRLLALIERALAGGPL